VRTLISQSEISKSEVDFVDMELKFFNFELLVISPLNGLDAN